MLAHDLAKMLLEQPNIEVKFAHPSHDYWRTELATNVDSITEEPVKYSEYHRQDKIVDNEYGECVDGARMVLIVR